jgi:hypothetical protein
MAIARPDTDTSVHMHSECSLIRELYCFIAGINDAIYRVNEDDVIKVSEKVRMWRLVPDGRTLSD